LRGAWVSFHQFNGDQIMRQRFVALSRFVARLLGRRSKAWDEPAAVWDQPDAAWDEPTTSPLDQKA
jgi:hypothetical protein